MTPKFITVHCSATVNSPTITSEKIKQWHLEKGYTDIGYHFVIHTDGQLVAGRNVSVQGAHVYKHNRDNLGICLIGGVDENGKTVFNYTDEQISTLKTLVSTLQIVYSISDSCVKGHRDWFGDTNGDGVVDRRDWLKECPCFNVAEVLELQQ